MQVSVFVWLISVRRHIYGEEKKAKEIVEEVLKNNEVERKTNEKVE